MSKHALNDIFNGFDQIFADIPVPKHPLDNEQAAPFTTPDLAALKAAKLGIEQIKRRNAENTPTPIWPAHKGGEL